MRRAAFAVLLIAAGSAAAQPATAPQPESCLLTKGERPVASAEHDGKAFRFPSVACRDLFLSDPERYSQLFEALGELQEQGQLEIPGEEEASLVPS